MPEQGFPPEDLDQLRALARQAMARIRGQAQSRDELGRLIGDQEARERIPRERPPLKAGGSRGRMVRSGVELLMRLLRRRGGNVLSMDELERIKEHSEQAGQTATDFAVQGPRERPQGSYLRRGAGRSMGFDERTEEDLTGFYQALEDRDIDIGSILDDAQRAGVRGKGLNTPEGRYQSRKSLQLQDERMLAGALNTARKAAKESFDQGDPINTTRAQQEIRRALKNIYKRNEDF